MCVCSCPDAYSGDISICVCSVFLLILISSVKQYRCLCIKCFSNCPNAYNEDTNDCISTDFCCPNYCNDKISVSVASAFLLILMSSVSSLVSSCPDTFSEDVSVCVPIIYLVVVMLVVNISVSVYLVCFCLS